MSGADWVIGLLDLFSAVLAASQGFFFEIFSFAGVVVGYLLAAWNYHRVAERLAPYVSSSWVADLAGFLLIFLAIVLLAGVVGRIARWAMKEAGLRWFDRVLGAVFGILRGVLVAMVFVLAVATFAPQSQVLANSRTAPYLLVLARAATWLAPSQLRQQFRAGMDVLHGFGQKAGESQPKPQPR